MQQPSGFLCPRRCNPGKRRLDRSAGPPPHGLVSSGAVLVTKENDKQSYYHVELEGWPLASLGIGAVELWQLPDKQLP
ncbi:hypothetical protein QYF61_010630 [Mycteria americana]|uniref:Uncharacterized protein n=1 Tax=Mycteria americana TaxID=33587 RepID=A0AAN7NYR6_MYCAM|nr:hypothetical protein QYF61_010630 [Mycteria americana]